MSLSYFFAGYLLVHLALLTLSFRWQLAGPRTWLIRAILIGVIYDNAMLLLSSWYGAADWLTPLNYPRWWLHGLLLPLLSLYMLSLLRQSGVAMAFKGWFSAIFVVITVLCLSYGIWYDIVQLQLTSRLFEDPNGFFHSMERFNALNGTPPLGTIFTNLFILPFTVVVWRKSGWPWLFAGTLTIFLINGASAPLAYGFLLGNFAEILFLLALLKTEQYFGTVKAAAVPNS
ncbi:hypothetical protein QWY20_15915 [Alkalimonas sp. MEB108]|uniref:Uncharacterized protein n=1 Tax=Alkalimonas cellulosilytica TaxID=3058395 RepID=A0ABU7J971_9GAMM|nr:hypothetical protein [Alkalimonas sp. MEB108]MEE2002944.1 hypothetical protein [Alkalimonas sp. MEB108]